MKASAQTRTQTIAAPRPPHNSPPAIVNTATASPAATEEPRLYAPAYGGSAMNSRPSRLSATVACTSGPGYDMSSGVDTWSLTPTAVPPTKTI